MLNRHTTGKENVMKGMVRALFLVGTLLFSLAGIAGAATLGVGDTIYIRSGLRTLNGGEFMIYGAPGRIDYLFSSFCLERDESLMTDDTPFIVDSISDSAQLGGVNTNSGDPLDQKTKWLYWNFLQGRLDDISSFEYNDPYSMDAVQLLIWQTEGEGTPDYSANASLIQPIMNELAGYYDATGKDEGFGDVRALNISYATGGIAQSILVAVPEPGTMVLLGMGMLGLAVFGKRRMNR